MTDGARRERWQPGDDRSDTDTDTDTGDAPKPLDAVTMPAAPAKSGWLAIGMVKENTAPLG